MTAITTGFGAGSTALEVVEGLDLHGRRAIVTGAGSMGVLMAQALASAGAEATLAVRNLPAAQAQLDQLPARTGEGVVLARQLDLTRPGQIRSFVDGWSGPLHILVNNAGIMTGPERRTEQGWELRFATNHLGHFALAVGLHDAMAAGGDARIVSVSSSGHLFSPVVFDDIHFRTRAYDRYLAYGQSKTANILFAVEASRRWAADGITANSLTPGIVPHERPRAELEQDTEPAGPPPGEGPMPPPKSPEQGAATALVVATSPLLDGVGGRYFEDCNESKPHPPGTRRGYADYAVDEQNAARLWQVSQEMLADP